MDCKSGNHCFISVKEKILNGQNKQSTFKVLQMGVGLMNPI